MTKETNPGWSIEFNFEIPPSYRRTFLLQDGDDCLLILKVEGKVVSFESRGGCGESRLSAHLDWLEDSLCQVRWEFGQ